MEKDIKEELDAEHSEARHEHAEHSHSHHHGEECGCHHSHHHHESDDDDEDCCCNDKEHHHHHEHGSSSHGHSCGCGHCHHDEDEEEDELSVRALVVAAVFFVAALLVEHLPLGRWLPFMSAAWQGITVQKALSVILFFVAYIIPGRSVLMGAVKVLVHHDFLDEEFLMAVSSVGAIILGKYPEAAAIMLLYQAGEKLEDFAVEKSHNAIEEISSLRPDRAFVKQTSGLVEMDPDAVPVGSVIVVKVGDRIPIDGTVVSGESFIDTSALTGESVPRRVCAGDEVLSGSVNKQGVLEIRTVREAGASALTRILELVENATENKTRQEQFVTRFARVYTPVVCGAALALALVPSIILGFLRGDWSWSNNWSVWFYRALMFLVVSCPCALVISIPLSFSCGITASARNGILIKGSTFLEALSRAKTAVFDKTGTLTKGNFVVTDIHSVADGISNDDLIRIAAHAEALSTHPVSSSLKAAHHAECCEHARLEDVEELAGRGIKAVVDGVEVLAGNSRLMEQFGIEFSECPEHQNGTIIHVACNGKYSGHIVINDEIKEDSKLAIRELRHCGVDEIVMLTGDNQAAARQACAELGIERVYAGLLSEQKLSKVEELLAQLGQGRQKKGTLIYAGDGINDAPVLARADAGIAMGALGSDAAVEAADIIIMEDKPSKIAEGIRSARRTVRVVYENLIGSLGTKGLILILSALGISNMWVAVFGDVGVTMVAVLNSIRLLRNKKAV